MYVGNSGVTLLASTCADILATRDHRLETTMASYKIEYILTLSYALRLLTVASKARYLLAVRFSELKQVMEDILLPDFLAKYIESIGVLKLANGASIAPIAGDYDTIFPAAHPRQIAPHSILARHGIARPENAWSIYYPWIHEYNQACARAVKTGLSFRSIRSESEGRVEMAVSYYDVGDRRTSYIPEVCSETAAELGAIYAFRRYGDTANWLQDDDNNRLLWAPFSGKSFNPSLRASRLCLGMLVGDKK